MVALQMRLQPQIEVSSNCHCHRPADRSRPGASPGRSIGWTPGQSVVPEALARTLSSDGSAPPSDRPQQRIAAPGKKSTHLLCNASIGSTALGSSLLVLQMGARTSTMNGCYCEWVCASSALASRCSRSPSHRASSDTLLLRSTCSLYMYYSTYGSLAERLSW